MPAHAPSHETRISNSDSTSTPTRNLAASPTPAASGKVHIAITRTVKPGCEADFERAIGEFFERAENEPGSTGAYLIRPFRASADNEYGVLRSFNSLEDKERFYRSAVYHEWNQTVAPLVVGTPHKHELHGMEAFFNRPAAPPAWKMAIVTWLGVNPAVFLAAEAVRSAGIEPPPLVELMLVNVLVVAGLTWVIMPLLTRLFRRWLEPGVTAVED
ncbi:MAG: antibiotic biosynthesis monooxygenase [Acidobacteriota bacterium]